MNEEKRLYYLDQMGIQAWVPQTNIGTPQVVEEVIAEGVIEKELNFEQTSQQKITSANLDELKLTVSNCTQCELHRTRTQTVFGVGHPAAEWLIIGEAPGADEDRLGEPFVGRAGQLLTSMLRSMGLAREEVFIANILKCRPPNNRDPQANEINSCSSYLRQQIELIQPKIILVVGRIAAQSLLNVDTPIGKMRGKKFTYQDTNIPVVATYHPAYLLRSPQQKRSAWEDLKFALKIKKMA
ncbi:MAG: uracil-DNA glycosylase [Gammaproteobacteria bacterium]|nr:uracil-DNA glycosylase [Gammaproteobacteria bacterium]